MKATDGNKAKIQLDYMIHAVVLTGVLNAKMVAFSDGGVGYSHCTHIHISYGRKKSSD